MSIVITYLVIAAMQIIGYILFVEIKVFKGHWCLNGLIQAFETVDKLLSAKGWTNLSFKKPLEVLRLIARIVAFPIWFPAQLMLMLIDTNYFYTPPEDGNDEEAAK